LFVTAMDVNVIVWVAVIRDQGTALIVACELDFIRVDGFEGHHVRLSINLDHGVVGCDRGGSQLWVSVRIGWLNVAPSMVEFNAVSGLIPI